MTLWLVRSGRRGEGESYALTNSVVGIGFAEFGDLSKTRSLDEIRRRMEERRPDAKPSTVTNWAGQVDAFVHRIKEGDLVAYRSRALRPWHSDVLPADTASCLMRLTR